MASEFLNGQRAIFPVVWPKAPTVGATGLAPEVGNSTCLRQCFKQANITKNIFFTLRLPAARPQGVFNFNADFVGTKYFSPSMPMRNTFFGLSICSDLCV